MRNPVYEQTVAALADLLQSSAQQLASGNGCRFVNTRRGKATVYHSLIAGGNRAEIAFNVESFADRLNLQGADLTTYFKNIGRVTNRPVHINAQWEWPRVGIANEDDLGRVIAHLQATYSSR